MSSANSDCDHDGGFLASTNQTVAVYRSDVLSVQRHCLRPRSQTNISEVVGSFDRELMEEVKNISVLWDSCIEDYELVKESLPSGSR